MADLSRHAKDRIKERCGVGQSGQDRLAEKALVNGILHNDTTGRLNKWMTTLYFRNTSANNIRLYGDKAYIFSDTKLITVLQIPNNLLPMVRKISKRKDVKVVHIQL